MELDAAAVAAYCNFEAYGGESFGSVKKDHQGNFVAVLAPVILAHTSYGATASKPAHTKLVLRLCTATWQEDEFCVDPGLFAGRKRSSTCGLTRKHIGVDTEKLTHICEQLQSIMQPKSKRAADKLGAVCQ